MARLFRAAVGSLAPWQQYAHRLRHLPGHLAAAPPPPPPLAQLDGSPPGLSLPGRVAMKILQLTRQFLPAVGGLESVVEGLSVALKRNGHTVQVATLRLLFSSGAI